MEQVVQLQDVSREEPLAEFLYALKQAGMRAALACLRHASGYRCIGVFRVEGWRMQTVEVLQHDGSATSELGDWREIVECSCYLRDDHGQLVQVGDSPVGAWEPAGCRAVPIMAPEGEILGTLCLYDPWANGDVPIEFELLVAAAATLAGHDALRAWPQPRCGYGMYRAQRPSAKITAIYSPSPSELEAPTAGGAGAGGSPMGAVAHQAAAPRSPVEDHPAAAVQAVPERGLG